MFHMPNSRFAASAAHLAISASLFLALSSFVYFFLLPGFLFYSEGGVTILSLIGGVDVVLGPLITLVIYNKTKPGIKLDLSIVAVIQIAALLYGVYSLWSVRPIAVFYAQNTYHIVYRSTFEEPTYTDISKISALNRLKPPTLAIDTPNGESLDSLVFKHVMNTGQSYFYQEHLYKDYQQYIPHLKDFSTSPTDAVKKLIIAKDSPLAKLNDTKYGFFKFTSSLKSGYIVLDLNNGEFIDIII